MFAYIIAFYMPVYIVLLDFPNIFCIKSEVVNISIPLLSDYQSFNEKTHFARPNVDFQIQNVSNKNNLKEPTNSIGTKLSLFKLFSLLPSIKELLPVNSTNNLCSKHSRFSLQEANYFKLWALRMIDSTGKISSGLLNGNVNQLGDFDQCLNVHSLEENHKMNITENEIIFGKYCLISIDITLPYSLRNIDDLIHSHYVIQSKLSDPGHRVPKFTSIYWAICVPHTCSNTDVNEMVVSQLQKRKIAGLKIDVMLEEHMCQTKNSSHNISKFGTILTIFILTLLITLTFVSTLIGNDYVTTSMWSKSVEEIEDSSWRTILDCFSLKKNIGILLNYQEPSGDVACLHGIRTLNAIALLLSHKCMQLLFYSYVNRTEMTEMISYPHSMLARSAIVYTDSFILLSGCLAAQCFLKNFDKNKKSIINNYFTRYIRLTPNLIIIILFCTFILPHLNSGPLWNVVISKHAELCKIFWWRNLLYVHNYYGFEEMCLTHTHQLGIDMQLYIFSPILIYTLWRLPLIGIFTSIFLAATSTYLRYQATLQYNLSPIIYHGVTISQLFNTASLSYILPTHRATSYIMGILLGYYLHNRSSISFKLNKMQIRIGTFLFSSCAFVTIFGTYWMSNPKYKYIATEAALYMAFSSIVWCAALIWVILISINGYTGQLGNYLKWSGFRIFTRIAYSLYLIQFPVYFYNVGTTKYPVYFTTKILFNIGEFIVILALSVILTLLVDLPFQNISRKLKLRINTHRNNLVKKKIN